jgi:hypothetical protein
MKARVMVAGLVTAGLLALTGCGSNPQVAAYVGDAQVSQASVDAVAQVLADTSPDADTAGAFTGTVMQIMVQGVLAATIGQVKGITVTDAQRQTLYSQNALYATLLKNPVTADFMKSYADTAVILSDASALADYKELLTSTDIRVNPRFGTWDHKAGGLVEGSTGSLSELAPKQG